MNLVKKNIKFFNEKSFKLLCATPNFIVEALKVVRKFIMIFCLSLTATKEEESAKMR